MGQLINETGAAFAEFVLSLADFLKGTSAPGMVALLIFITAFGMTGLAHFNLRRACSYPVQLTGALRKIRRPLYKNDIHKLRMVAPHKDCGWLSDRQTRVFKGFFRGLAFDEDGKSTVSSAAPIDVMTRDALGLKLGAWRIVPATLVGVGLALTFLGLIAALREAGIAITASGEDPAAVKSALSGLLTIASAKFIMSLAGLTTSIFFGLFLKIWETRLDAVVEDLSEALSACVIVQPPETALRYLLASALRIESALERSKN